MLASADDEAVVRLEGVSKSFREGDDRRVVFEGLSATFPRARITAVVGRSGTGKSTLLNLISGIDRPDAGAVHVEGVRLDSLTERSRTLFRRRHIGFVFQFFNLLPTLTVEENLYLPLELLGLGGVEAERRIHRLLEEVGLADRARSFPDRLSGGEQQRVAIARALVHEPSLVVADEPTGNLDSQSASEALALLAGLAKASRRSLVMVTHSEDTASAADRVLRLHDGALRPLARSSAEPVAGER